MLSEAVRHRSTKTATDHLNSQDCTKIMLTRNLAIVNRSRVSSRQGHNSKLGVFHGQKAWDTEHKFQRAIVLYGGSLSRGETFVTPLIAYLTENREIYIPHLYSMPP